MSHSFIGFKKYLIISIHHSSIIQNTFTLLRFLCGLFYPLSIYLSFLLSTPTNHCLCVPIVFPFTEWHVIVIKQYIVLLLSLRNMHLRFLHIFHGLIAHFFLNLQWSIMWMHHHVLIHSSTEENIGCF